MSWSYYTLAEAQPKLGKRVQTKQPYFSVPVGTKGTVVALDERYAAYGDYAVIVRWDLPSGTGETHEISFTPAQYNWALTEIEQEGPAVFLTGALTGPGRESRDPNGRDPHQ